MQSKEYNYKLTNAELKEIIFGPSGTYVGISSQFGFTESDRKSLVDLIRRLINKPGERNVDREQKLFADPKVSNAYRALCMVERCRLLYSSLDFPLPALIAPERKIYITWLLQWLSLYNQGLGEKIAKYQSVGMFNKLVGVEPLEAIELPFGWCLGQLCPFYGIHMKMRASLFRSNTSRFEFFRKSQCFLYFKKGCPKSSETFIEQTIIKHKKALTSEAPMLGGLDWTNNDEAIHLPRKSIKKRIREIVEDVLSLYEQPKFLPEPSRSASYNFKKREGGQISEIEFRAEGWYFCPFKQRMVPHANVDFEFHDTGYGFFKVPKNVEVVYSVKLGLHVKPIALCEPLKVRMITKGSAGLNYILSPAQKKIWDAMQKHPWFCLTGRPVTSNDIPINRDKEWISVDYSAATDCLSSEATRLACKYISRCTGLPYQLMFDSLSNHKIHYSDCTLTQTNGQLMGDKLSFPILCLLNAAAISLTVNPDRYDRRDPILINGDDGLFLGKEPEYKRWKVIATHFGLTPSIGKVYKSDQFCVINSQLFMWDHCGVRDVPYPNASGMMQFDARTYKQPKTPYDLGDSLRLWLSGFPSDTERMKAENLWYRTFKPILETDWVRKFNVDYYLPISLGGLGLPIRMGCEDRFVGRQALARARYCLTVGLPYINKIKGARCKVYDPNRESFTYRKVSSHKVPSDEQINAIRAVGWKGPITIDFSRPVCSQWYDILTKSDTANSSVALSVLNGIKIDKVAGVYSEKVFDITSRNYYVLKKQRYWNNYCEVRAQDLQWFSLEFGSRKLVSWKPEISKTHKLLSGDYNAMLELAACDLYSNNICPWVDDA